MKQRIKQFALDYGVDDVGIAAASDYRSVRSPKLETIMPGVRSMVVMAFKEPSSCESANPQVAMSGRLDLMSFSRSCNYKMVRFMEKEFDAGAMAAPVSYPLEMGEKTMGLVGDVSLRHAAVAAGLGAFGRNNLLLHPKYGSRILFTAVLTDLAMDSDAPYDKDLCTDCNLCVEKCPTGALDEEGKTDAIKCLRNSQPYGIGTSIRFWSKYSDAPPEEKKAMVRDVEFWKIYQAGFIGFQYFCWNCMTSCPVGRKKAAKAGKTPR
jgi:epoxyqueuosine reductase